MFMLCKNGFTKPRSGYTLIELTVIVLVIGLFIFGAYGAYNMMKRAGSMDAMKKAEKPNHSYNKLLSYQGTTTGTLANACADDSGYLVVGATKGECVLIL